MYINYDKHIKHEHAHAYKIVIKKTYCPNLKKKFFKYWFASTTWTIEWFLPMKITSLLVIFYIILFKRLSNFKIVFYIDYNSNYLLTLIHKQFKKYLTECQLSYRNYICFLYTLYARITSSLIGFSSIRKLNVVKMF